MTSVFIHLINISIAAFWLILAIIILRLLWPKAPKWFYCLLWSLVGIRLVCPFTVESVLSLVPSLDTFPTTVSATSPPKIHTGINSANSKINPIIQQVFTSNVESSVNTFQIVTGILSVIWIVGICVLALYLVTSYILLHKRMRTATLRYDNIYESDRICSPFIFGIIKPKIYVPYNISEEDFKNVIAHEQAHIRRKDYIVKPLAFLTTAIYWFNPLVWVAYLLLCRDIELACDEKVVKGLCETDIKSYSYTLLNFTTPIKTLKGCPVAFGEVAVKHRIINIKKHKEPTNCVSVIAVVIAIVMAVCFLTSPAFAYTAILDDNVHFGLKEFRLTAQKGEPDQIIDSSETPHKYYFYTESFCGYPCESQYSFFTGFVIPELAGVTYNVDIHYAKDNKELFDLAYNKIVDCYKTKAGFSSTVKEKKQKNGYTKYIANITALYDSGSGCGYYIDINCDNEELSINMDHFF